MAVNEQIVTGRKWRKLIDEANKIGQRISFWTKASDVEFNDAKTAETKVGAIDGITDSLVSTSSRIAASAKALSQLNNNLNILGNAKMIEAGFRSSVMFSSSSHTSGSVSFKQDFSNCGRISVVASPSGFSASGAFQAKPGVEVFNITKEGFHFATHAYSGEYTTDFFWIAIGF